MLSRRNDFGIAVDIDKNGSGKVVVITYQKHLMVEEVIKQLLSQDPANASWVERPDLLRAPSSGERMWVATVDYLQYIAFFSHSVDTDALTISTKETLQNVKQKQKDDSSGV